MTEEQAKQIKLWRFEFNCSFRRICENYFTLYHNEDHENQIDGKILCDEAQEVLCEKWKR